MIDIILVVTPFYRPDIPIGVSQLKPVIKNTGFNCKISDLNIYLYNRVDDETKKIFDNEGSVQILDNFETLWNDKFKPLVSNWIDIIKLENPKYLGFSIFSFLRTYRMLEKILDLVRTKIPEVKLVVGGHAIGYENLGEKLLKRNLLDYYIYGEGEIPLVNLLNGITTGNGINNYELERVLDLESIPIADFSDYNIKDYKSNMLPVYLSRGCINNCMFCIKILKKYVSKSGKKLADEILYYYKTYGTTEFELCDSLISGNKKIYAEFINTLYDYRMSNLIPVIKWSAMHFIWPESYIGEDLFYKMKKIGCDKYAVGLESGSYKIRKDMRKTITNESVDFTVKQCHKNKIMLVLLMLIGFTTETEEDFQMTLDLVKKYEPYKEYIKFNIGSTYYMSKESMADHIKIGEFIEWDEFNNWIYKDNTMLVRMNRWLRFRDELDKYGYIHNCDGNLDYINNNINLYKGQNE